MGLDVVEIVLCIEERLDIRLPNELLKPCETVGDLYEVAVKMVRESGKGVGDEEIWQAVVESIVETMGMEKGDIRRESTLVGDITLFG